jgi:hypothetical protein
VIQAFKDLIEKKHLYQSVSLRDTEPFVIALSGGDNQNAHILGLRLKEDSGKLWWVGGTRRLEGLERQAVSQGKLLIPPPHAKMFCKECDRTEPFNVDETENIDLTAPKPMGLLQVFVLSYRCQSCKGPPEVLLVRRDGEKLTLCGRAPIEHVDAPNVIPKTLREYYSKAIVASQSGDTLAGNFRLRTLIEQWAKAYFEGKASGKADEVIDAYMETLPNDFKARFASLRELYGKLSDDIHEAIGSPELFESARADLIRHFEARRVYQLPDKAP